LIGILLTEGDAALGETTGGVADGAGGAHRGHDGESSGSVHVSQGSSLDPASQGLKGAVLASTSGEILDPVAAKAAAALAAATGGAVGGTLPPPDGAPAGSDGDTIVVGGTSITFGAGASLGDPGLGSDTGMDGAQPTGRIGTHHRN
jgi:hypothetical protein